MMSYLIKKLKCVDNEIYINFYINKFLFVLRLVRGIKNLFEVDVG